MFAKRYILNVNLTTCMFILHFENLTLGVMASS